MRTQGIAFLAGLALLALAIGEFAAAAQNETVQETAAGLAPWPSLKYRIP